MARDLWTTARCRRNDAETGRARDREAAKRRERLPWVEPKLGSGGHPVLLSGQGTATDEQPKANRRERGRKGEEGEREMVHPLGVEPRTF